MLIHFWLPFIGGLLAYVTFTVVGIWFISRCDRRHSHA